MDKPDLIASLSGANSVAGGSVVSGRVEVVVLVVVVVVVGASGVVVEVVVVVVVVVVVDVVVVPGSVQTSFANFCPLKILQSGSPALF